MFCLALQLWIPVSLSLLIFWPIDGVNEETSFLKNEQLGRLKLLSSGKFMTLEVMAGDVGALVTLMLLWFLSSDSYCFLQQH
jgi:hypothetical protein